jgi:hypothetical protein
MTAEYIQTPPGKERDYKWVRRAAAVTLGVAAGSMFTWSPHEALQNDIRTDVAQHDTPQDTNGVTLLHAAESYLESNEVLPPWTVPDLSCVYFRGAEAHDLNIVPQAFAFKGADSAGHPTHRVVPPWEYAAIVEAVPSCS